MSRRREIDTLILRCLPEDPSERWQGSHLQKRVREWGHKSHEGLKELWDYGQLQGEGGRREQEGVQ